MAPKDGVFAASRSFVMAVVCIGAAIWGIGVPSAETSEWIPVVGAIAFTFAGCSFILQYPVNYVLYEDRVNIVYLFGRETAVLRTEITSFRHDSRYASGGWLSWKARAYVLRSGTKKTVIRDTDNRLADLVATVNEWAGMTVDPALYSS